MPGKHLTDAVRANVVETVSGLLLVVGGSLLNLVLEGSGGVRFIGYMVSTVGTLLISWALTRAWVSEQHDLALGRSLRAIVRPLSTATSQLNQAVHRAMSDDEPIRTDVLESSVQHLFGVLSDLQLLIGAPISVEDVVVIKGRLDVLGEELAAVYREPEESGISEGEEESKTRMARALEEVEGIKLQLESALVSDRTRIAEVAECPACKTRVTVQIGNLPNDSAMATCQRCGLRFHVHRKADNSVISRAMGNTVSVKRLCPACGNQVPLTVRGNDEGYHIRYCLGCFAKLKLTLANSTAELLEAPTTPLEGKVRWVNGQAMVVCPVCEQARKPLANREGTFFANCLIDNRLVRAPARMAVEVPTTGMNQMAAEADTGH